MESRASGEKIIDYRSSSSTWYIYTRKEKFSFVHRRESRKVGTVRGQNYWTGLSLRNLFLSPPSHIHRLTLEGFSKFRFKAVPMKNPRIRTVPRYLAYKMFPPTVLEGNVPRDFHAPPPPPRDHPSFFPFPDRSVQIYRFVWIEGEKARRRGWEKMVSQNGRGLRERREREKRRVVFHRGINDRTYCSLPQPPLYRWRDLCQVYRRTRPFLFDRDNVDVAASLFPAQTTLCGPRVIESYRRARRRSFLPIYVPIRREFPSQGGEEGASMRTDVTLRYNRTRRLPSTSIIASSKRLPFSPPPFLSHFRRLIKTHPGLFSLPMISRRDHEFYTVDTYAETELSRRVERRKKGEIKGKGRNLGRRDSASHIFISWLIESVNNQPRCPDFQIINRISSSFQFE